MEVARGRVGDFGKWQKPEYLLAPNFHIPPDGPLALGRFVKEIDQFRVLNKGSARVPIPESDLYLDVKKDIVASVNSSSNHDAKILAQYLDRSLGGHIGFRGAKTDSDIFNIQRVETTSFDLSEEYTTKCRQLPDIKVYLEHHDYKKPVYLITGLKIVYGASFSVAHGQASGQEAGAGVALGNEALNLEVKGEASHGKNSGFAARIQGPSDFVLGIRLQKFYHKKKFLLIGENIAHDKPEVARAVLMDSDYTAEDKDDQLVPVEMSDEEATKMVL
ncbi:unnamed protein product [Clonostachys solani]|uniref:Uncharacterized protein n=1 Tax=Clonostachys solani TaxID=160281 RepID=A0A9P0EFN2_9HYPO|nr:unnamed protein product [Clonostachys solani]